MKFSLRNPGPPAFWLSGFSASVLLALCFPISAIAQLTSTWQTAGNSTWATVANWDNGVPNAADATAIISNTATPGNHVITLANPGFTVGTLSIEGSNATASTITIQTSTLTFKATGGQSAFLNYQGSNYTTINSVVNLLSDLAIQAGTDPLLPAFASTLTISGRIDGNGNDLYVNAGHAPATTTINGAITGAGTQLIKTGGGALVLSNVNNTFSGGLDISAGTVRTTLANAAGVGVVLGAGVATSGADRLGIGDIKVANTGVSLTINSGANNNANQHATLAGGLITLEKGGNLIVTENDYRTTFRLVLNSGTISGGSDAGNRGILRLNGTDFVYNADGTGGSAFIDAPTLIFNTAQSTTAMNVTLNNTVMQSGLGLVHKIGNNALTFTANDTGTFVADEFIVESGLGAITLNQTLLDLANGLTFTGTNATFANRLTLPTGSVSFGRADQLAGATALSIGENVITNLLLNGYDQTFSSINLDTGARLGIWMSASTPATLTIGNLSSTVATPTVNPQGANYLSIYNWTGNPASHLLDGTVAVNGNTVKYTGSVDLDKVWFRGYAPGAVLDASGNLIPADFLHTAAVSSLFGGNWFDFANWTVDIPNTPGAVITFGAGSNIGANISLQNQTVTVGHFETYSNGPYNSGGIGTGTLVFDSGINGVASTISGTGALRITANVRLVDNDLIINSTGIGAHYLGNAPLGSTLITGSLFGDKNIEVRGSGLVVGGNVAYSSGYTGNIDVYSNLILSSYHNAPANRIYATNGSITMHQGSQILLEYHYNAAVDTRMIIEGDFTTGGLYYIYNGDVELTADRKINFISTGGNTQFWSVHGFADGFNFTGAGGLHINTAGNIVMDGDSSVFSGGFTKSGASSITTRLHSDFVIGALSAGNNYWGSGALSINAGALVLSGSGLYSAVFSGSVYMANAATLNLNAASTITDTVEWTVGTAGTHAANLYAGYDLALNTPFLTGYINLYANPGAGVEQRITSTMAGGLSGIGTLAKQGAGNTTLDTVANVSAVTVSNGILSINGNNYIRPRSGLVQPTLTMSGGLLQANTGTNSFNTLSVTGNAGFMLSNHTALLFAGINTWAVTGNTYQLSLANDSGIWSTAANPTAYDTYVYFTSTSGFSGSGAARLGLVAFTGYEKGAALVQVSGSNVWFLAPTGDPLSEWVGAMDGSNGDTDRLWSSGSNWVGGVPNLAGRTVAIRDVDSLLDANSIIVDMDATVGKLQIESSGGQVFTINSANGGVLTFDNGGNGSVLTNQGAHTTSAINVGLKLDDNLSIQSVTTNALVLSGHITGNGAIYNDSPYAGNYNKQGSIYLTTTNASGSSTSDFTGGFWLRGSSATAGTGAGVGAGSRQVRIGANGSLFGSGSLFGDGSDASLNIQALNIGDGTAERYYSIRTVEDNAAYVVDASIRFAGNLNFATGQNSSSSMQLTFQSTAPSYVTSGTWLLFGYGSYVAATLTLKTDIQGPGGFRFGGDYGSGRVNFDGYNTFSGGILVARSGADIGIGSDSALGTGTINIQAVTSLHARNGARIISNDWLLNASANINWNGGNFTLNSGSSTLLKTPNMAVANGITVVVTQDHIMTGTAGINLTGGGTFRLEGANTYTGNTSINAGTLSIGSSLSLGSTGTLSFGGGSLASYGGPVTFANDVLFTGASIGLNGSAGLLTLDPASGVTLNSAKTFTVTGTAALGSALSLNGDYGITKTGLGTFIINSANSAYTGNTAITQGTLRVNAVGDITLGASDAGNNYLGTGHVTFTSGNYARLLELVTTDGSDVNLHGNLALTGNSAANTASINVTDTAGAVSGAAIKTNIVTDTDSTISGNANGYLRAPGDIIKTGVATLYWTGGNIVTPNFVLHEGTLDLGAANSTRTGMGSFTLGTATLNISGSQTFANTLFNLAGSGTINMNGASGASLLTFTNVGTWDGTLDIINWNGNSTYGGGVTQVRFVNDVLTAFDYAKLATINFHSSGAITYAPGAKALKNTQQYYELIPIGVSSIWNGDASGNNWSNIGNWESSVSPDGPGAVAVFSTTLQLNGGPVNIDVSNLKLGGLMFINNTGENYSLIGQAITFEQMGPDAVANLALQNNNSVSIENNGLILNNQLVVSTQGTGTLTIGAPVSGTQSMIKSGAGEMVLSNNTNSFSGGVTLLEGTLTANASSATNSGTVSAGPLGTGTLTVAGTLAPTLAFTVTGAQTIDNAINLDTELSGETDDVLLKLDTATGNTTTLGGGITQTGAGLGSLEKIGAGTLVLSTASAHTGTTTVSAGTLAFTAASAIASSTQVIVNAVLATGDTEQTLTNLTGIGHIIAGDDGNTLTGHIIARNAAATTFSGSITGDGSLTKTGTGALTLSGINTHSGSTTIHEGTLAAAAANAGADAGRAIGGNMIYFDNTLASAAARLLFADSGTLALRTVVFASAIGTIEAAPGAALTVTAPGAASSGGAVYMGGGGTFNSVGNIVYTNNISTGNGGAFYLAADGVLNFSTGTIAFHDNRSFANGGAIYAAGDFVVGADLATLVIQGGSAANGGAAYSGGGMYFEGDYGNFIITSNTASVNGGGLHAANNVSIAGNHTGTLAFTDNRAGNHGGALYAGAGDIIIGGSYGADGILLASNIAHGSGGAGYAGKSILISATSAGALNIAGNVSGGNNGALAADTGTISITGEYNDIFIRSNTASTGYGGALSTGIGISASDNRVEIDASVAGVLDISNNYANKNGGAMAVGVSVAKRGYVYIGGSYGGGILIASNTAGNGGGGAIAVSTDITIDAEAGSLVIRGNYAKGDANNGGGAFRAAGNLAISGTYGDVVISSNTTTTAGGAFSFLTGGITLDLEADTVTISNNTAGVRGGAINSGSGFSLSYARGVFSATGNKAANDASGGFLYAAGGSMLFDIGANATAAIGSADSITNHTDSISAASGVSFTKRGAGTLTLWANNTYTGTTYVNGGTLDLRGYISSTHTLIAASSTLAGTGTAGGDVTIQSAGHLAPGASPGLLAILGNLALQNNAQLDWELGAPTDPGHIYQSGTNDLVIVGGNVTATGTNKVNLTLAAPLAKGEYDLINYAGTLAGDADNFAMGTVDGSSLSAADLAKYRIVTTETNWIKLTYDLGGYAIWDGDNPALWNNGTSNGGNGTWYAPGMDSAYMAWTGTDGTSNGEWEQAEFAIFKGASGTVTVDNSGTTILFSGAQFRTDGYLLTGGTLTTGGTDANITLNIDALDYQTSAAVTTTIATQITGTHGVEKAGGGTLVLTGSNTYSGTTLITTGTLMMANAHALSVNTATIAAGATLRVATGSMTWSNTLTGEGLFHVALASSTDSFLLTPNSLAGFTGTALFNNSALALNNNALAASAVILGTNNTTTVAGGTHNLDTLTIDGATLVFTHGGGTNADGIIRANTLDALGGTITVTSTHSGSTGLFDKPLLQQDEGYRMLLIDALTLSNTNLTLTGGTTATADIKNTASVTTATATYAQTLDYTDGLAISYELTQLALVANQTTTLSGDETPSPSGAAELHAQITGAGNLQIDATNAITLNNAANTYTGTTLVNTGTLISGTNNALGQTAWLAVTNTAAYDLSTHTQTITDGATIEGTLHGSGSLGLGGLATITSTNAAFAASVGVTGTTTINNTQALGNTGTINTTGQLILTSVTGTLAKQIAGIGTVSLAATSSVALTGANTLSGTWDIAQNAALYATTTANLGTAAIANDGQFTIANATTETLGNVLTGTGYFIKQNTGTLTIARANAAYTGSAGVLAGTLRLENLQGVGTGLVINNAILDLAGTGDFANNTQGAGTTTVSGAGVNITGTNQTTWNIAGSGTVSGTQNLGAGATHIDGLLVARASSPWAWSNTLTGTGTLAINLGSSTFDFNTASGTNFAGVVSLENVTYTLFHNTANEAALANATLRTQTGSIINLGTNSSVSGSMKINDLELIGGVINVHMATADTAHVLEVENLTVADADAVSFNLDTTLTPVGAPTTGNFLDQDSGTNSIQLIKAAALDEAGKQMTLLFNGAAPADTGTTLIVGDGHGHTDIEAIYNYAAFSSTAAYGHDHEIHGPGIYVDYLLTELKTNTDLVLDSTTATDKTLGAKITGTGNLELIAGTGHIVLTHSNSYTGTTTITSGTLVAGATDALGQTTYLVVTNTAALDIRNHTQTIANGGSIAGGLFGTTGSLGLGGFFGITSTNTTFSANVGVTGTTVIHNASALGDSGTIAIAENAALQTASATGTFFKALSGTGAFELHGTSTVTLAGTNTHYSGTFAISATSRLIAETTENLGTANLSGSGVFEKQNAATGITITHANTAFTGTTLITGGTLAITDLGGLGTSEVINNAILDLAATGTFSNNITGSGTSHVSSGSHGSYTVLTGANQTAWHITGAAQVSSTANLGAGNTRIDGELVAQAASPWVWTNTLSGSGTLLIDTTAFAFANTTGTAFAGTVELHTAAFDLSGDNTLALTNATLQIDENASVTTGTGIQQIGNLTLQSGTIAFALAASGTEAAGVIRTNHLEYHSTAVVIDTTNLGGELPLLQQDESRTVALVESVTSNTTTLITNLVDQNGAHITDATTGDITQNSDTVATGTYDYGVKVSATGMHLDYALTDLVLHDGKTAMLTGDIADSIMAGADELHATVSGSGSLRIEADDTIYLNGANSYTGTTTVATGTLVAGVDDALGATAQLYVLADATFDLRDTAQTIANGGQIDGTITGSGALTLSGGTMTIASANTGYTAQTNINEPATVVIEDAAGLGASNVALAGVLEVRNAAAGTLTATLAGSGTLVKSAAGTLTVANANALTGLVGIKAGRLIATNNDALGTANIDVEAGAIFEQNGFTGTLQNTLAGSGTHMLANARITIADAAKYGIANTALDNTSVLTLADNNITLGTLTLGGGWLAFADTLPTATIATLGNAGNIIMNADMSRLTASETIYAAGQAANHLDIDNAGNATHTVYIEATGEPAAQNVSIVLVSATTPGAANFVLGNPGGKLEYDLTALELVRGDGSIYTPEPNTWYLSDRSLSHAADAIIQTAATLALDWAYSLDALHLRMGELRAETVNRKLETGNSDAAGIGGNVWVRARGYRLNANSELTGYGLEQYGWGATAGADKAFDTENGVNLLGAFIDMGSVDRKFDNSGNGKTHSVGIGAYGTILKNDGWFIDAIARLDRYSNKFEAKSYDGKTTRGNYTTKGASLSLEAGRRLQRADGWWLEPGVQIAALWLNGATYSTQATADQRAIKVKVNDSDTWQYRALVRFGKQIPSSRWNPYGKFAAVAVDSNGGTITAHGKTFQADYDGKRVEFGFGTSYRINDISQVYIDYEYAKAAAYERPWSLNLGYRRLW